MREYILHLQEKNKYEGHPLTPPRKQKLTPCTIRAHVQTLKAFFSWLCEEGYTEANNLEALRFPKVPKRYVDILSDEEIRSVLSHIDQDSPAGARNAAIIVTLLDTGIRCKELSELKVSDVHINQGYLKVMGKGARERTVPLGSMVSRALIEYLRARRPSSRSDNVFLTESGDPMTVGGIQLMIKRLGRRCGVPRLHAHLCRHTFATDYLMNGGDIFTLQQILGHSSLEMVRRYVTLSSEFVIGQHSRFSPLDAMHPKVNRRPRSRLTPRSS